MEQFDVFPWVFYHVTVNKHLICEGLINRQSQLRGGVFLEFPEVKIKPIIASNNSQMEHSSSDTKGRFLSKALLFLLLGETIYAMAVEVLSNHMQIMVFS